MPGSEAGERCDADAPPSRLHGGPGGGRRGAGRARPCESAGGASVARTARLRRAGAPSASSLCSSIGIGPERLSVACQQLVHSTHLHAAHAHAACVACALCYPAVPRRPGPRCAASGRYKQTEHN
eukprot:scaffold152634_cov31-Tisochrysis_lutea.AAC.5